MKYIWKTERKNNMLRHYLKDKNGVVLGEYPTRTEANKDFMKFYKVYGCVSVVSEDDTPKTIAEPKPMPEWYAEEEHYMNIRKYGFDPNELKG